MAKITTAEEQRSLLRSRPPVYMNEKELSIVTGLSSRFIRDQIKLGAISRIKIGRRVLFRWAQVEKDLQKLES